MSTAIKGWEGAIRVATTIANAEGSGADEAEVQNVAMSNGNNVEALYELGSRGPTEVKEGNIDLSIDVEVQYVDGTPWPARAGVGNTGALTSYYFAIYPKGYAASDPEIRMYGKFGNYNFSEPQDGVVTESMTFVGESIVIGAAPIG